MAAAVARARLAAVADSRPAEEYLEVVVAGCLARLGVLVAGPGGLASLRRQCRVMTFGTICGGGVLSGANARVRSCRRSSSRHWSSYVRECAVAA